MTGNILVSIFKSIPLWVMLLPIFLASVVALAVFIERMIFFRSLNFNYRKILLVIVNDPNGEEKALEMIAGKSGVIFDIIREMLKNDYKNQDFIIQDLAETAIRKIERFGSLISTVATVSPMIGLLGTVTGMMKSFGSLAKMGPSAKILLASGITEALITTALGLSVAIPAITFYNYMVSKVNFYINEIEYIVNTLTSLKDKEN